MISCGILTVSPQEYRLISEVMKLNEVLPLESFFSCGKGEACGRHEWTLLGPSRTTEFPSQSGAEKQADDKRYDNGTKADDGDDEQYKIGFKTAKR